MKLPRKILLILALVVGLVGRAQGQAMSVGVQYSPLVEAGQRFTVSFTFSGPEGTVFSPPTVTNAKVAMGPVKSKDVQGTNIYTYTLIAPAQSGVIKLSGAFVTAGGRKMNFQQMVIEVVGAGGMGGRGGGGASRGAAKPANASTEVLLRTDVDKRTVYVGESLCATLTLYRGARAGGLRNTGQPKYATMNGFWSHDLTASDQPTRAILNGKSYTRNDVRQWLLFPQRAGSLTIESNTWPVIAQLMTGERDVFGDYEMREVPMELVTPPVSIKVLPLPTPAPVGYDGAVGQFTMETTVGASTLSANSAGTVTIKLTGTGNFPLIKAPALKFPVEFESYETKTKDDIKNTPNGAAGVRAWEIPFIARAEGEYTIPALEFSYFDPKTRSYKTLSTGEFHFKITRETGGGGNKSAGFISGVTKEDLKMLGQDIRFIKLTPPNEGGAGAPFVKTLWFYLILVLEALAAVVVLVLMRKYIKLKADVVRAKSKGANKVALKRLRKAKGYMESSQIEKFFEEMLRALWGYMGDKLAIEVADLTKERIRAELYDRGVESDQSELFLELIAQCEMAQYAPAAAVPMRQAYEQALEVIGSMEIK